MSGQMQTFQARYKTMREALEKRSEEFAAALPKSGALDAKRFIRTALTTFQVNPQILDCTPASVTVAMLQAAAFGLELDPVLGQAYLVPYGTTCQLIIGYRGYMNMARRSGQVTSIQARVVHAGDVFEYEDGLDRKLVHKPSWEKDPGPVIGAYCIARFKEEDFALHAMSLRELNAIRDRSRAKKGPWSTDLEAMYLKTVIRHSAKFWPIYIEDIMRAAELDDAVDTGRDQVLANIAPGIDLLPPAEPEPAAEEKPKTGLDKLVDAEQGEPEQTKEKVDAKKAEQTQPAPAQDTKKADAKAQTAPATAKAQSAAKAASGAPESPARRDVAKTEQLSRHEVPRAHQQRIEAEASQQDQPDLLSDEENRALDRQLAEDEAGQKEVRREPGSDDE
jgi:recombination protein RecT